MATSITTLARANGGARPADGSSFGNAQITGRQLTHYTVYSAGLYTFGNGTNINYLAAGSDYEKLVLAIEQVGSIELLGYPQSGNLFHVALSGAAPAANASSSYYTTKSSGSLEAYANTYVNGSGVSGATVQLGVGTSASATQVLY
jgi:hypothetical protein